MLSLFSDKLIIAVLPIDYEFLSLVHVRVALVVGPIVARVRCVTVAVPLQGQLVECLLLALVEQINLFFPPLLALVLDHFQLLTRNQ